MSMTREERRAYNRAWWAANKEKQAAYKRANKDALTASRRRWTEANPEKQKASEQKYREKTREYQRARGRAYHEAHKEQINARKRTYSQVNRDQINARRRHTKYGISGLEQLALWEAQGRKCALCPATPTFNGAHLDHDHTTGQVRGFLCRRCNTGIGYLERFGPQLLAKALDYLHWP